MSPRPLELFKPDWQALWGTTGVHEDVGAVYTRPEIVRLILDMVGYVEDSGVLASRPLLEPSCGDGAFLSEVCTRLFRSESQSFGEVRWGSAELLGAVRAIDLSSVAVGRARSLVKESAIAAGCPPRQASAMARRWINQGDFLLEDFGRRFSFVVGNPPYVRLEGLPKRVLVEYRRSFETLTDRADLYIAFFEKGMDLLQDGGGLAFICANRFAKNQYGAALRRKMTSQFRVRHYLNLEHTQPFEAEVSAYPAIVVVDRQAGGVTRAATLDDIAPETLQAIRAQILGPVASGPLDTFDQWFPGGMPWTTTSAAELTTLADLASSFPVLEESGLGTRVGIGVATGADEVFILPEKSKKLEAEIQLPLLMPRDVAPEGLTWSGFHLLNPFKADDSGELIELKRFPGAKKYLQASAVGLRNRHVAKKQPQTWYRTIDRVWTRLVSRPKLVIPDIQRGGVVGYDSGEYYPHHNLYWIVSDEWDLRALQAILRSSIVLAQVRAHSVQMRGGSVRYQAQTLRRLRVPAVKSLSDEIIRQLVAVAHSADQGEIDRVVSVAYGKPSRLRQIA